MGKGLIGSGGGSPKAKRKQWPVELKRRIVEASLVGGASVSQVARRFDVNANQAFLWRRLYKRGLLETPGGNTNLLPVHVTENDPAMAVGSAAADPATTRRTRTTGIIQVEMAHGRLRIEGAPDPLSLRLVLEQLRG